MTQPAFKRATRVAAACAALVAAAFTTQAAQAAAVVLTAQEQFDGGALTNVMDGNANGGDFFYTGFSGGTTTTSGGTTFFHTYGTTLGLSTYFGARASGTGTFFAKTSATYTDSITNNSGASQNVTFSFNVDQGEVGVDGLGEGYADLLLALTFAIDSGAAQVVASEHGRVSRDAGGVVSCTDSGQDAGALGGYLSCASSTSNYATGSNGLYSATIALAAGATLNVNYSITSEVVGKAMAGIPGQECITQIGGNNEGVLFAATAVAEDAVDAVVAEPGFGYAGCYEFNAISRSGDPAGFTPFNTANFSLTAVPTNAVPEPGSWGLAAMALIGLVATRRRRG